MKNNKLLKVLIPLCMILVIVGIWFVQNQSNSEQQNTTSPTKNEFPLHITEVNLEELSKHKLPIIIDFGADECVPCKQMEPVLELMNKEMQGKAIVQFVDVWKSPEASSGFPVQLIPTQIFVNADGTPYVPSKEISSAIQFNLYSDNETKEHIFTVHQGGLTEEQMRLILEDMGVK